ncbi:MAG: Membrane-bound lytic murein transglycosylase F [bacterium]|nr:Membrane-bound lytic murein transglycosylase F [bacterium]
MVFDFVRSGAPGAFLWFAVCVAALPSHADKFHLAGGGTVEGVLIRDDTATVSFEMEGAGIWTLSRETLVSVERESAGAYWLRVGEKHARGNRIERARNAFLKAAEESDARDRAQTRLKDLELIEKESGAVLEYPITVVPRAKMSIAATQPKEEAVEVIPERSEAKTESAPVAKTPEAAEPTPAVEKSTPATVAKVSPRAKPTALQRSGNYSELIRKYSRQYGVDPLLVRAIIAVESEGNPRATSSSGAQGLMQLMPDTAARVGVRNPYDAEQNIRGGIKYLSMMFEEFAHLDWEERVTQAVAAYHAGPNRIKEVGDYRRIPATLRYTQKVASAYEKLRRDKTQEVALLNSLPPALD